MRQSYSLRPFATVCRQLGFLSDPQEAKYAVINLVGNVVMFLPLGLLPTIWQRQQRFGCYVLTVALTIVLVEAMQLFSTLGHADIDDWILNMLGACMGYGIWRTIV